jgi:hypothetical protein
VKPKWISSYNLFCLLNLPFVVALFGPILRLYWEGAGIGEKLLQKCKALWMVNRDTGKNSQ